MNKILLSSMIVLSGLCALAPSAELLTNIKQVSDNLPEAKKLILQAPIQNLDTSCLECIAVNKRCEFLRILGFHNIDSDREGITRCRALLERFSQESYRSWESINTFMGKDILDFFSNISSSLLLHPYNILPVEFLAVKINSKTEKEEGTEAWLLIDFCTHIDDERLKDAGLKPLINVHLENTREKLTQKLCGIFYDYSFDSKQADSLEKLKTGFRIFNLFAHMMDSDGGQTWEDRLESIIRTKIKDERLSKQKANSILFYCKTYLPKNMVNLIQRISSEVPDANFE